MSRMDLNELLIEALGSPDFQRAYVRVSEAIGTRPVRLCRCVVIEIPNTAEPEDFAVVRPGTVTAFVGREGEPLLRELTEMIAANKSKDFNSATDRIKQSEAAAFENLTAPQSPLGQTSTAMPAFAELSYADKTLISYIHVDEVLRVNVHPLLYNGGSLDRTKFAMIEYYERSDDIPLTCVLVIRQPHLSDIEREALRLVPSTSANNVAVSVIAPVTPAFLKAVIIATPYAAQWIKNEFVRLIFGAKSFGSIPDEILESKEFIERVRSLPPEVTAAELLRLRTDVLLDNPPR